MLKAFFSNPILYFNAAFAGLFYIATPFKFSRKLPYFLLLLIFGLFAWPIVYFRNRPETLKGNLFDKAYLAFAALSVLLIFGFGWLLFLSLLLLIICNLHLPSSICPEPSPFGYGAEAGFFLFIPVGLPALIVYVVLSSWHFFERLKLFQNEN